MEKEEHTKHEQLSTTQTTKSSANQNRVSSTVYRNRTDEFLLLGERERESERPNVTLNPDHANVPPQQKMGTAMNAQGKQPASRQFYTEVSM